MNDFITQAGAILNREATFSKKSRKDFAFMIDFETIYAKYFYEL